MAPKISSSSDLQSLAEEFEVENGAHKFKRTVFAALDDDDVAYWGAKEGIRKYFISPEEFEATLQPIPDDWMFPDLTDDLAKEITIADTDDGSVIASEDLFIKRPKLSAYDPEEVGRYLPSAPRMLLEEIHILETLSKNPHPNIVRYHGARVRRGRVTGILLSRHSTTLDSIENNKPLKESLDRNRITTDLESAVAHLHALGLAHNDINPTNILIGRDKEAVLADFGSCQPVGKGLMFSRGTPGWMDEGSNYETSEMRHDLVGLRKVGEWMENVWEGKKTGTGSYPLEGLPREFLEARGLA
ncbi:kinase-like protein [Canariomyces notabilis]|uniref:Kinase-like protein n=1 Tax=Canariomyces notabilis TaxID=2074819 RepID=A0AAN6QE66_9PEZI|nr:kinase-like protein [Canariomyces arenarius]